MGGAGLIQGWSRLFLGMIGATWRITGRGDPVSLFAGLMPLAVVTAIVIMPLIVLTVVYLIQKVVGAFSSGPA